ncbi:LTA synthase family protein [Fervidibacillus halotolerans]|uniref:LTA synthase family protein n=1 Tax=Fervidibacillus halotolerans TaxID=2980027 RepID=A0A9E8LYX9_9BACI|nr:LTA synthase family protein [Fervidibacillus halotolerans]WAA12139.1 LTA synthase family protein [Fervidibacillus halotolerans]
MQNRERLIDFFKSSFFIFTVLIVFKIIVLRYLLFGEMNILNTIIFELGIILVFMTLIEMLPSISKTIGYLLINIIFSTLFLAVAMYHSYFGRIVTYFALFQFGQVGAISDSIFALIKPVYLLFFIDVFIIILFMILRKFPVRSVSVSKKVIIPVFALAFVVSFLNFYMNKDEFYSNNVVEAKDKGVLNYELIEIYRGPDTALASDLDHISNENVEELKKEIMELKGLEYIPPEERNYFGAAEGRNLIVIQVESMQNFPIGLKVGGQEVTPNMNRIIEKSFYFSRLFQQTGPGNTSDAEFLMNTSLFPTPFNPTSQTYGNKIFPSLPRLLKEKGYASMTFHADEIEFWNRIELYPALGFDTYYDETFFGKKDIIGMGSSDEYLFNKAFEVLKAHHVTDQKFYAHLVTLTTHHPFTIPSDRITLDLPEKFQNTLTGNYLISMNYVDRAIGELIDRLKEEGMYEESVIVIYGDHFGLQQSAISEEDTNLVSDLLGHEYKTIDRLNIPFILHVPGVTEPGQTFDKVSGQMDMMPTVANLLGITLDDQIIFGQDLLNSDQNLLGVRYYLPIGSFFNDEILFIPEKGFEDGTAYDIHTEEVIEDFEKYKEDYDRVLKLEAISDEYMKNLPER